MSACFSSRHIVVFLGKFLSERSLPVNRTIWGPPPLPLESNLAPALQRATEGLTSPPPLCKALPGIPATN